MNKGSYPSLRKLHGSFYEWKLDKKKRLSLLRLILQHKVLILGTPEHGNLGDNAIVIAMYAFLQFCGVPQKKIAEITYSEFDLIEKDLKWIPRVRKLILGVGGGNFGDLWYNEQLLRERILLNFQKCSTIIFPQTILYEDQTKLQRTTEVFQMAKRLALCARDQKSFELMHGYFDDCCDVILSVPDIVLFMNAEKFGLTEEVDRHGALLCMRQDKEKCIDNAVVDSIENTLKALNVSYNDTDTVVDDRTNRETRLKIVQNKISEFMRAELVITDRLHGMVFAAITGTPCIVFGNNHHKVSGTYDWIKDLPYIRFFDGNLPSENDIKDLLQVGAHHYDNSVLMPHYNQLKALLQLYLYSH